MKKLTIIILSSFVAAFVFSFSLAFAAEGSVRVYYSESLGMKGEEKVYHISSCQKAPSFGPVRCLTNPEDDTKVMFEGETGDQCRDKDGAILDMAYVRGCYKKANGEIQYMSEKGSVSGTEADNALVKFPDVDVTLLKKKSTDSPPGCADKPENQGPLYAPEWAILDMQLVPLTKGSTLQSQPNLLGTVVWPGIISGDPPHAPADLAEYAFNQYSNAPSLDIKPMYRAVLCDEYDVLAAGQEIPVGVDISGEGRVLVSGMTEAAKTRLITEPKPTSDEQCNTNNANKDVIPALGGVKPSTIINPEKTYSCTIKYLISGDSGSEVLAKYIGALYKWAAGLVGIISVLIIVFSGIQISAAGGDSAKLDTAKNRIAQSLIGIVILFLAGLILYTINPTFFVG